MENGKILQPNELAQQLAEMPKDDQRLVPAFVTHAALGEQDKGA